MNEDDVPALEALEAMDAYPYAMRQFPNTFGRWICRAMEANNVPAIKHAVHYGATIRGVVDEEFRRLIACSSFNLSLLRIGLRDSSLDALRYWLLIAAAPVKRALYLANLDSNLWQMHSSDLGVAILMGIHATRSLDVLHCFWDEFGPNGRQLVQRSLPAVVRYRLAYNKDMTVPILQWMFLGPGRDIWYTHSHITYMGEGMAASLNIGAVVWILLHACTHPPCKNPSSMVSRWVQSLVPSGHCGSCVAVILQAVEDAVVQTPRALWSNVDAWRTLITTYPNCVHPYTLLRARDYTQSVDYALELTGICDDACGLIRQYI
jgi:hypothetical protein